MELRTNEVLCSIRNPNKREQEPAREECDQCMLPFIYLNSSPGSLHVSQSSSGLNYFRGQSARTIVWSRHIGTQWYLCQQRNCQAIVSLAECLGWGEQVSLFTHNPDGGHFEGMHPVCTLMQTDSCTD